MLYNYNNGARGFETVQAAGRAGEDVMNKFGELVKKHRLAAGYTLREFCLKHQLDPGNFSRIERGLSPPPQGRELIERYAVALGLGRGSDDWLELFDAAAAERGEIPADLMSDEEVVEKLPVLFRTLRARQVSAEKLDELVERIRRS